MKTLLTISLLMIGAAMMGAEASPTPSPAVRYDASGRMVFPADYRKWTFLSSGLNMSYTAGAASQGDAMFGNTFVQKEAYERFEATGVWPEGTAIVLENRAGSSQGSINKRGQFQTPAYMGAEVHVKDASRFKGGWAFFSFDVDGRPAPEIAHSQACYACHEAHAAADTTFVQFYPTLFPIAKKLGVLSKAYLSENPPLAPPP